MNVGVKHTRDKANERRADRVFRPHLDAELERPSLKGRLARAPNHGAPHPYVVLLRPEVNVGVGCAFQGLQFLQCGSLGMRGWGGEGGGEGRQGLTLRNRLSGPMAMAAGLCYCPSVISACIGAWEAL